MMKRIIRQPMYIIFAAILLLFVAACGGREDSQPVEHNGGSAVAPETPAPTAPTPTPTPTPEPIVEDVQANVTSNDALLGRWEGVSLAHNGDGRIVLRFFDNGMALFGSLFWWEYNQGDLLLVQPIWYMDYYGVVHEPGAIVMNVTVAADAASLTIIDNSGLSLFPWPELTFTRTSSNAAPRTNPDIIGSWVNVQPCHSLGIETWHLDLHANGSFSEVTWDRYAGIRREISGYWFMDDDLLAFWGEEFWYWGTSRRGTGGVYGVAIQEDRLVLTHHGVVVYFVRRYYVC